MGQGVTDDKDLIVKISDYKGGGTSGQLIIDDVSVSAERDNTSYSGIGNDGVEGVGFGNKTYSFSGTTILNSDAAELAESIDSKDYLEGYLKTPNTEYSCGQLFWDDWEVSASDDGDVTFEVNFTVSDFSFEPGSEEDSEDSSDE